jgi:prepilin-type N-terminal cleavage/methylation domain-containing protein
MIIRRHAFTLIELLVVIAIIAMLVSIVLPSLNTARMLAKITKAHADLRNITLSLQAYSTENNGLYPPTRKSCSTETFYELPIELASYLPASRKNDVDVTAVRDPFDAGENYRYRAVGEGWQNESTKYAAYLCVPDDFPDGDSDTIKIYDNPSTSPVLYAVWSNGPDTKSAKFGNAGTFNDSLPLPKKYWLTGPGDSGVIMHCMLSTNMIFTSR